MVLAPITPYTSSRLAMSPIMSAVATNHMMRGLVKSVGVLALESHGKLEEVGLVTPRIS